MRLLLIIGLLVAWCVSILGALFDRPLVTIAGAHIGLLFTLLTAIEIGIS